MAVFFIEFQYGRRRGLVALPAEPATDGLYLPGHETSMTAATLTQRLSGIAMAHRMAGFVMDTRHPDIASVMRGLRNRHDSAQRHAVALTAGQHRHVVTCLGDSLGDGRDRALLLVGTAAALRHDAYGGQVAPFT